MDKDLHIPGIDELLRDPHQLDEPLAIIALEQTVEKA